MCRSNLKARDPEENKVTPVWLESDFLGSAQSTLPTGIDAVDCKLFRENLRCAVTIFGSETIIFFMQLHIPYFFWDSFQYAFAAFKTIEIIYFMELQFWRFSELILHKFLGGGGEGNKSDS